MFRLNLTLCNKILRTFPQYRLHCLLSTSTITPPKTSSPKQDGTASIVKNDQVRQDKKDLIKNNMRLKGISKVDQKQDSREINDFANTDHDKSNTSIDLNKRINEASTSEELITIMKTPGIEIHHIKKILSLISYHSNVQSLPNIMDFMKTEDSEEKNEMHLLSLSTPLLVTILKGLCTTGDRNKVLLKKLTHNIAAYNQQLSISMCCDILYSLAMLTYINEDLLEKVIKDIMDLLPTTTEGKYVSSIASSLRLLRYKHCKLLDTMCEWTITNLNCITNWDIALILRYFATFQYNPSHINDLQIKINSLEIEKIWNVILRLDLVWALVMLDKATASQVSSVLNIEFLKTLRKVKEINKRPEILKLLNINGAAQFLIQNYKGPLMDPQTTESINQLGKRKQKITLVDLLKETLQEIAPATFKMNVNTSMGFYIDAECYLDSNNTLIKLEDYSKVSANTRLAIMILDFHDFSYNVEEPLRIIDFYTKLLNIKGYKVLHIPYHQFSINDTPLKRVKYLKKQLSNYHIK